MPRANLADLLGKVDDPEPAAAPTLEPARVAEPPPRPVSSVAKPLPKPKPSPRASAEPLYLRLVRKEARLREEQYAALTQHARRLSRARHGQGSRITENTLIRIAVDLLLDSIDRAAGADEAELLESLR
ncbi:MAG: hypothetical protein ABL886_03170 [Rhodoglobus sp.]|jgi:hypothetical protein